MSNVEFASLLCSRLCHDLISPVGSLGNGLELLADEDDPAMRQRCLDLVADSARQTANKLKFFRLAFGAGGGFGAQIDAREAKAALEGLFPPEKRIAVEWMVPAASLPKGAMKILLNLAMTAGDALLRGGRLNVAAEERAGAIELAVRAEGARVLLDPEIKAALDGRARLDQLAPRAAAAYLVRSLVDEAGAALMVSEQDGALVFGAALAA